MKQLNKIIVRKPLVSKKDFEVVVLSINSIPYIAILYDKSEIIFMFNKIPESDYVKPNIDFYYFHDLFNYFIDVVLNFYSKS